MRRETHVAVQRLLDPDSGLLHLTQWSDWGGLDRRITRPRIQKPGLALTGFVRHLFGDRPQIFGLTEIDYLLSIDEGQAQADLKKYFEREPCCIILTRGLEPPDILVDHSRRCGVPILTTPIQTSTFISLMQRRLEDLLAPKANVHGVLMDVLGVGMLIIGRSGVGKSEAALDLVLKGHRLVADDVVEVTIRQPDTIWGAANQLHQHHMEIRGMGILNITKLFGVGAVRDTKKLEVVVELSDLVEQDFDRLGTERNVWPILGVDLPLIRIPLRPGRNIASLIEVVARNQLLKVRGHDSAREFQERIAAHIAASASGVPMPMASTSSGPMSLGEVE